jgi:hypothetical protein
MLAVLLLTAGSLFAAPRVFVGVGVGGYMAPAPVATYAPPPAAIATYVPPAPGPGYAWVGGYWYPGGRRWLWRSGYWARPPYVRSWWVAPRYFRGRWHGGYWRR